MTLDRGKLIPFTDAQAAVDAINAAWEAAVDEVIEDGDLRVKLQAQVAANVFKTMVDQVAAAMSIAIDLDPAFDPTQEPIEDSLNRRRNDGVT